MIAYLALMAVTTSAFSIRTKDNFLDFEGNQNNDVVVIIIPHDQQTQVCGFEFPVDRPTSHVTLEPLKPLALTAFTLTYYAKMTGTTTGPHLLSYAVSSNTNLLLISLMPTSFGFSIAGKSERVKKTFPLNIWTQVTWTWDGFSGDTNMYLDSELIIASKALFKGSLKAGGHFMFGQEQDSVGGSFDAYQRFIGSMSHFMMWDQVLDDRQLKQLMGVNGAAAASAVKIPPASVFDDPPSYTFKLNNGAKALAQNCHKGILI